MADRLMNTTSTEIAMITSACGKYTLISKAIGTDWYSNLIGSRSRRSQISPFAIHFCVHIAVDFHLNTVIYFVDSLLLLLLLLLLVRLLLLLLLLLLIF